MAKLERRVQLGPNTDLRRIVEEVNATGVVCVLERGGTAVAVITPPEGASTELESPPAEGRQLALRAAGAWRDLDTDALITRIYQARDDAPSSPAPEL